MLFRRALAIVILILVPALFAACSSEPATAREALDALRSALADDDGERIAQLHDPESRAFYRSQVREVRARLERGDSIAEIFPGGGQTAGYYADGSEDDALARFVLTSSEVAARGDWLAKAEVVGEESDDDSHVRLRLRGQDDQEQELFFVRTVHGWAHDAFRQFRSR